MFLRVLKRTSLFLGLTCVLANSMPLAHAANTHFDMPEGLKTMTLITNPQLTLIGKASDCAGEECNDRTIAKITLPLGGCFDVLGPVTVQKKKLKGMRMELYVTAFNVKNPDSEDVMCIAPAEASVSVDLGEGIYEKDKVKVLTPKSLVSED